jgi:hypothetical protein
LCVVADGVTEEEQYREPEPEDPYLEEELPEGFEMASPIPSFDAYLSQFYKHNLLASFIKCIILLQDMVG